MNRNVQYIAFRLYVSTVSRQALDFMVHRESEAMSGCRGGVLADEVRLVFV